LNIKSRPGNILPAGQQATKCDRRETRRALTQRICTPTILCRWQAKFFLADPLRAGMNRMCGLRDRTLSLTGPEAVLTARRGEPDQAKGGRSFPCGPTSGAAKRKLDAPYASSIAPRCDPRSNLRQASRRTRFGCGGSHEIFLGVRSFRSLIPAETWHKGEPREPRTTLVEGPTKGSLPRESR